MAIVSRKVLSAIDIDIGCPQGSRLSPLLFLILMADLDLHVERSALSNFTNDTQSIIIQDTESEAINITKSEADSVIEFFGGVSLVNNPDKACLIFNSQGKHKDITMEVGGFELISKKSDKLLGMQVSSNLNWTTQLPDIPLNAT